MTTRFSRIRRTQRYGRSPTTIPQTQVVFTQEGIEPTVITPDITPEKPQKEPEAEPAEPKVEGRRMTVADLSPEQKAEYDKIVKEEGEALTSIYNDLSTKRARWSELQQKLESSSIKDVEGKPAQYTGLNDAEYREYIKFGDTVRELQNEYDAMVRVYSEKRLAAAGVTRAYTGPTTQEAAQAYEQTTVMGKGGKEAYDYALAKGLIPKDAIYVPQEGTKWGYITPGQQRDQINQLVTAGVLTTEDLRGLDLNTDLSGKLQLAVDTYNKKQFQNTINELVTQGVLDTEALRDIGDNPDKIQKYVDKYNKAQFRNTINDLVSKGVLDTQALRDIGDDPAKIQPYIDTYNTNRQSALGRIAKYQLGEDNYDLVAAINAGVSKNDLQLAGFDAADIDMAGGLAGQSIARAKPDQDWARIMSPYAVRDASGDITGYNIEAAIAGGVTRKGLLDQGFLPTDVDEAITTYANNKPIYEAQAELKSKGIKVGKEGEFTVEDAVKAGVSLKSLSILGVSGTDYNNALSNIKVETALADIKTKGVKVDKDGGFVIEDAVKAGVGAGTLAALGVSTTQIAESKTNIKVSAAIDDLKAKGVNLDANGTFVVQDAIKAGVSYATLGTLGMSRAEYEGLTGKRAEGLTQRDTPVGFVSIEPTYEEWKQAIISATGATTAPYISPKTAKGYESQLTEGLRRLPTKEDWQVFKESTISLTPVLSTIYFWKQMGETKVNAFGQEWNLGPAAQAVSVAGDALFVYGIAKLITSPIIAARGIAGTSVKGTVNAETKGMVQTANLLYGKEAGKAAKVYTKAVTEYADNLDTIADLKKTIATTRGEVVSEVESHLATVTARTAKLEENVANALTRYQAIESKAIGKIASNPSLKAQIDGNKQLLAGARETVGEVRQGIKQDIPYIERKIAALESQLQNKRQSLTGVLERLKEIQNNPNSYVTVREGKVAHLEMRQPVKQEFDKLYRQAYDLQRDIGYKNIRYGKPAADQPGLATSQLKAKDVIRDLQAARERISGSPVLRSAEQRIAALDKQVAGKRAEARAISDTLSQKAPKETTLKGRVEVLKAKTKTAKLKTLEAEIGDLNKLLADEVKHYDKLKEAISLTEKAPKTASKLTTVRGGIAKADAELKTFLKENKPTPRGKEVTAYDDYTGVKGSTEYDIQLTTLRNKLQNLKDTEQILETKLGKGLRGSELQYGEDIPRATGRGLPTTLKVRTPGTTRISGGGLKGTAGVKELTPAIIGMKVLARGDDWTEYSLPGIKTIETPGKETVRVEPQPYWAGTIEAPVKPTVKPDIITPETKPAPRPPFDPRPGKITWTPGIVLSPQLQPREAVVIQPSTRGLQLTQTQLQEAIGKAATQYKAEIKTGTSQRAAIKNVTKVNPAVKISQATQQQASTITALSSQTATQTQAKTQTQPATQTTTKTAVQTTRTDKRPFPLRGLDGKTDKQKREAIKKSGGAFTWRQGKLSGKPVHHVVVNPFRQQDKTTVLGKPVEGALDVTGKGQAARSITLTRGEAPKRPVKYEGGAVDPVVSPTGKPRGVRIDFFKDPTVRRRNSGLQRKINPPRLHSKKEGRIFRTQIGRGSVLSRRPLGRKSRR